MALPSMVAGSVAEIPHMAVTTSIRGLSVFTLPCFLYKKYLINFLPLPKCSEKPLTEITSNAVFRRRHFSLATPNDRFLAIRVFRHNGNFF
jgi:hypothetical protein